MSRSVIERQLIELGAHLKGLRSDLEVADEQLRHFADLADDSRLRALVSETPVAEREFQEAERHAAAMRRHRAEVADEITQIEARMDQLLDQMISEG